MKRLSNWLWLTVLLAALALTAGGCKKQTSEWDTLGTHVSLTELREAFQAVPDKEVQTALNDALVSIRVGQYPVTLAALDKLATYSSATAKQKQVATKVIGEVKAMAAKYQPAPAR